MGWPQPQPEVVETILSWLREQDPRLSLEGLERPLYNAGYGEPEIRAAMAVRQAELDALQPPGTDLRTRAAAILIGAFFGAWALITLALLTGEDIIYDSGWLAALILGALLLPMLLIGLVAVRLSGRLKRGASGAMVVVLTVPFLYLIVIAGMCVVTTEPFS